MSKQHTRGTVRRSAGWVVGLLGLVSVLPWGMRASNAATSGLRLVDAPLTVGPGESVVVDLGMPADAIAPTEVEVTVRLLPASLSSLQAALEEPGKAQSDVVRIGAPLLTVVDDVLRVDVATEVEEADGQRIALPVAGTYALTIRADALGSISVPIIRRAPGSPPPDVPFGVVVDVDAPLSLRPDGTSSIATSARASMTRLVAFLESIEVPVSVSLRPELVDSLERSSNLADRDLVKRLAAAIGPHRVLSTPYLHVDPSIAVNAAATAEFTEQLRLGEDALNRLLGRLPDRRVWLATDPLSPAGAGLIRDLGAQVLVESAGAARDLSRTSGPTGGTMSALLLPTPVDDALALGGDDPARAAHRIAVELLLSNGSGPTSSVVIKPNLATANLDVLTALVGLTSTDESLQAVDLLRIGSGIFQTVADDDPQVADLSAARTRRAKLAKLVGATSAIVPAGDPRRTEWAIRSAVLLDTRLADDERAAYETQLRADLLAVQNNVVLMVAGSVNFGDRDTSIPVSVENRNDVAVSVQVRLVSSKLSAPASTEVLTLEPGATEILRIPVRARSNGRFPVTVQMLAPGSRTVVGKAAVINVRVGRLTGLGLVFTFAAGLALLSWWVQHLRRRLRRQETKELQRRMREGLPVDDFDDIVVADDATPASTKRSWIKRDASP